MKNQLQLRKDCQEKRNDYPIKLLKAIKLHILNYQDSLYVMEIIDDGMVNFLLLTQSEEPLHEYVTRFFTAKEIIKLHL